MLFGFVFDLFYQLGSYNRLEKFFQQAYMSSLSSLRVDHMYSSLFWVVMMCSLVVSIEIRMGCILSPTMLVNDVFSFEL